MQWTSFKETNQVLGAGNNPNTGDLPVAISTHPEPTYRDVKFCISRWQPSAEELQNLNEGKGLYIGIMTGRKNPTQPPVFVTAWNPFEDLGYVPVPHEEIQDPTIEDERDYQNWMRAQMIDTLHNIEADIRVITAEGRDPFAEFREAIAAQPYLLRFIHDIIGKMIEENGKG